MDFIPEMQEWFNIQKSINVIHHINEMESKISYDCLNRCRTKYLTNFQHLHIINSQQIKPRRECTSTQWGLYITSPQLAVSYSMVKSWNSFPLKSGTRQGRPPSPLLFITVLEVLVNTTRQEKEIRVFQVRKE